MHQSSRSIVVHHNNCFPEFCFKQSIIRTLSLHDSSPILDVKLSCYKRQIDVVREHYSKQHRNWHVLDASRSKWWLSEQCTVLMNEQLKTAQLYLEKRDNGKF